MATNPPTAANVKLSVNFPDVGGGGKSPIGCGFGVGRFAVYGLNISRFLQGCMVGIYRDWLYKLIARVWWFYI